MPWCQLCNNPLKWLCLHRAPRALSLSQADEWLWLVLGFFFVAKWPWEMTTGMFLQTSLRSSVNRMQAAFPETHRERGTLKMTHTHKHTHTHTKKKRWNCGTCSLTPCRMEPRLFWSGIHRQALQCVPKAKYYYELAEFWLDVDGYDDLCRCPTVNKEHKQFSYHTGDEQISSGGVNDH